MPDRQTGDLREPFVVDEEQQLIAKLRKIEALFTRPGSDGERRAAESASDRIRARLATLEAVERPVEYRFSLADTWSRSLFIAILRRHGLTAYRYRGQRGTTVMVKVAKTYVDSTLWPEFQQLQAVLHEHFATVTKRVVAQVLGDAEGPVEVREESGAANARLSQTWAASPKGPGDWVQDRRHGRDVAAGRSAQQPCLYSESCGCSAGCPVAAAKRVA